jgi:hypothetical protein
MARVLNTAGARRIVIGAPGLAEVRWRVHAIWPERALLSLVLASEVENTNNLGKGKIFALQGAGRWLHLSCL